MTEESTPKRQLPEDRQFRAVVIGCCIASSLFMTAFVVITLIAAVSNSGLLTADWYGAWGTWAGGAATAAAFLIAAFSLRVSSAHAHADRADAARIREDTAMAQARLLIISKIVEPGVPSSLASFQVENRSQGVFFDVKVPFVDCPTGSDGAIERRTPKLVEAENKLHEYLPEGELLVPFRSHTDEEAWFTLVTVHTSNWEQVKFAVEYTDAAGQRWKQHLGGAIQRVYGANAVPVRKADRFHPARQIQTLSVEERRELGGQFARGLPEDREADLAELRAIGPALVSTWKGVSRVGVPRAWQVDGQPGRIHLEILYYPTAPNSWEEYFDERIRSDFGGFGGHRGGSTNTVGVRVEVSENDIEDAVAKFDRAIQYANDQFEANEMAEIRTLLAKDAAEAKAASDYQNRLDERTAKLAKPDAPNGRGIRDQRGPAPRVRRPDHGGPRQAEHPPEQDRDE
jgi:hypothetical protein